MQNNFSVVRFFLYLQDREIFVPLK